MILYLVNASESPEAVPYVKAEMDILAWVNKPVIVLLNQMGEARPPEERKRQKSNFGETVEGKPLLFRESGHADGRLRTLLEFRSMSFGKEVVLLVRRG